MGDLDELRGMARAALQMPETRYLRHLRSRLSLHNYQRIADDIVRQQPSGRLLDWGAGFGQMSFLLRRRGLQVIGFDYNPQRRGVAVGTTALDQGVPLVTSDDPVGLPFQDRSFDAVLSCGVLEHVEDERKSLDEIWRVLVDDGLLLIYQLPQEWSYLEFIVRRLKLGYAHPWRYTIGGARRLLEAHGFTMLAARRANMLPKNFTGLPQRIRLIFDLAPDAILAIDQGLARLPVFNLVAGVLEIVARKHA